jgi:hypothetical protein
MSPNRTSYLKMVLLLFGSLTIALLFTNCKNDLDPGNDTFPVDLENKTTDSTIEVKEKESAESIPINRFKDAIAGLEEIPYKLVSYEELTPDKNFLNERIAFLNPYRKNQNKPLIEKIETSELARVRRAKVKSTESMGDNLYPRATIESWEFKNEQGALGSEKQVDYIKANYLWDRISKSPITYFRLRNEIIFITPGGFYMLDKVEELKDCLRDKLKLKTP